jgi:hypothetical protein
MQQNPGSGVCVIDMQNGETKRLEPLEPGQLWKLEHGYVYIVDVATRLIHYKTLSQPDQTAALTRLIGIEALLNYFQQTEAQLVGGNRAAIAGCASAR